MNDNLKKEISECLGYADDIEAHGIIKDKISTTFRENVRYEMLKLLAYLASTDGIYSK